MLALLLGLPPIGIAAWHAYTETTTDWYGIEGEVVEVTANRSARTVDTTYLTVQLDLDDVPDARLPSVAAAESLSPCSCGSGSVQVVEDVEGSWAVGDTVTVRIDAAGRIAPRMAGRSNVPYLMAAGGALFVVIGIVGWRRHSRGHAR